jgi:orotate phosphoribosyltransferase
LKGKVVIIDDAISLGTSVRESIKMTRNAGATPAVILIALDRMQRLGKAIICLHIPLSKK